MTKVFTILFFTVLSFSGWTQGPSMSDEDLLNAYVEKRNSFGHSSTKQMSVDEQTQLDRLVRTLEENYPDSYAYHYVSWLNGNYDTGKSDDLLAAYKLRPDSKAIQKEMFAYYTIIGDGTKQKEFAGKIKKFYSSNVLDYYRDFLPASGFVVTSNEADSYPVYLLQLEYGEGAGITVINLELMQNADYKKRVQQQIGLGNYPFTGQERSYMNTLLTASKYKNIVVSSTVNQAYLSEVAGSMYLTGLGYELSPRDQRQALEDFWVKVKRHDLSKISFANSTEKKLYGNYLPPLLTLYKLKLVNGEDDTLLKSAIVMLAARVSKSETVKKILEDYEMSR